MGRAILLARPGGPRPYVIVIGSEKGGTGKSTTAMHLAIALRRLGYGVGTLDLDSRQGTLTRYLDNRRAHMEASGQAVAMPEHRRVLRSEADPREQAETEDRRRLRAAFNELRQQDFVIVDTPGSDSYLSRIGHANADTLITPLNDSFLDIDVLATVDVERREVLAPSLYSKMVWEQNNRRVVDGEAPIDWIVMRNRLTHIESRNKREIADLLQKLAHRLGFRIAPGFGERVIFRELFHKGLTVLDLPEDNPGESLTESHAAARREIQGLLQIIGIEQEAAA